MLRSAAVFVVGAACLLSAAPRARACKCAEPPPASEAASAAGAVFEGRVTEIMPSGSDDLVVSLAVVRSWKGAKAEQIRVRTPKESAACGFPFAKDESYLVYADATPKQADLPELSVLHCGRTRAIADADADIAELGMGATPVSASPSELAQTKAPEPPPHKPVVEGVLGAQQNKPAAGGCASCGVVPAHTRGAATGWLVALALSLYARRRQARKISIALFRSAAPSARER